MTRDDNRRWNELRPVSIERGFTKTAPGSVRISAGNTMVLCTASIVETVPAWMGTDDRGWITAEYRMLPGSTSPRSSRGDRPDGRATEIQRLIGRSIRAVVDLALIGPRTVYLDCDVLQADGGTRTLSITGAFVALVDALNSIRSSFPNGVVPLRDSVAAVSIGIVRGETCLDLCYSEDSAADVDMNLVMTGSGQFIEIQGTGERSTFSPKQLDVLLELGRHGIARLTDMQKTALGSDYSLRSSPSVL